jgi:DNA replication protein DnaC
MKFESMGQDQKNYLVYRAKERIHKSLERGEEKLTNDEIYSEVNDIFEGVELIKDSEKEIREDNLADNLQEKLSEEMENIKEDMGEEEFITLKEQAQKRLNEFLYKKFLPLKRAKRKLSQKMPQLIRKVYSNEGLRENPQVWTKIEDMEKKASEIDEIIDEISNQSPEAFLANGLLKLREYKSDFKKHGLIETPEIKKIHYKIINDTRKKLEGRNGVVVLTGGTGTGKTVLARKIAEEFSENGEYEFVSAHSKMVPDDLISRMGIVPESIDPEKVPEKIEEAFGKYKEENPEKNEQDLVEVRKTITEVVKGQAEQKTMATKEILEKVGRAAEKGQKVVIDEFNYLPAETLGALNDYLAKTNAKEGFGFIFTGNIGKEFLKRRDLDPAFINRILEGSVKYNYPPQEFDKSLKESILNREEYFAEKDAPSRDLYLTGLTQLVDEKGNLLAPKDALEKLWDLSEAFSLIQQISQGEDIRNLLGQQEGFQEMGANSFKKIFLSFRNFNSIVRSWKLEGFSKSIDFYILNDIIRPAEIFAPKEAAQLFYFFKFKGFLDGEETDNISVDTSQWKISGVPQIIDEEQFKLPKEAKKLKAFTPQEVVEAGFGIEMPGYDEINSSKEDLEDRKNQEEIEEFMNNHENWFKKEENEIDFELNKIEAICS